MFKIAPLPGPVKLDDIRRTGMYRDYLAFVGNGGEPGGADKNISGCEKISGKSIGAKKPGNVLSLCFFQK